MTATTMDQGNARVIRDATSRSMVTSWMVSLLSRVNTRAEYAALVGPVWMEIAPGDWLGEVSEWDASVRDTTNQRCIEVTQKRWRSAIDPKLRARAYDRALAEIEGVYGDAGISLGGASLRAVARSLLAPSRDL